MFDKWLKLPAHKYLHLTALSILVVGITLSNVLMSTGTIWIIANWLLELDFKQKLERFKANRQVLAITTFFFLLVFSLFWSTDTNYGLRDILIKLPFITIPVVMGTVAPIKKEFYIYLWYLFLASLTFTTLFNFINFNTNNYGDMRQMSVFISHIRLGGLICIAIFVTAYHLIKNDIKFLVGFPILLWLLYYLYLSQTLTAYILFIVLLVATIFFVIKNKIVKVFFLIAIVLPIFFIPSLMELDSNKDNQTESTNIEDLVWYTPNGNSYYHDTTSTLKENGNYVWRYVSVDECELEWNKRSKINYDSTDLNEQPIYSTLFRYMTSLNLRKDSVGFTQLTDIDIENIENGQTNYQVNKGLKDKFKELYIDHYTYSANGDPNGHSFMQRIEHFMTGMNILKNHFLIGVGVGDVNFAFEEQYEIDNSLLLQENRHRAHSQLLTSWITTGVVGFGLICFILIFPLFNKNLTFPLFIVSLVLLFGFLTQDVIETQAGVTIFALFYALFNFNESYGKNR
jgi:O-antigen ligase